MRSLVVYALFLLLLVSVGCSNSPPSPTGPRPMEGNRIPGRPTAPPPSNPT